MVFLFFIVNWFPKFLAVLFAVSFNASAENPQTSSKTETFNQDPHWDATNNRVQIIPIPMVEQDFGFTRTHHAGKAAGEIGGKISQSIRPAFYAKPVPRATFEQPLNVSGSLSVLEAQSISGWHSQGNVYIGWFSSDVRDLIWRPRNFIGFRLQSDNEPDGALVELTYGTSAWQAGGMFVNAAGGGQERKVVDLASTDLLRIRPDRTKHHWTFSYNPAGGSGMGEIVFTFDKVETTLPLRSELRKAGASFDRFGIFAPRIPGRHLVVYFDDIVLNGEPHDFSSDPKWEELGNRARFADPVQYGANDFGFSPTSYAGGEPGELGGRFFSCNPDEHEFKGYYGDRIGTLTFDHRLVARGKFIAREFSIDSSFALGWFNSEKQDWPVRNFVGVYFDSLSTAGRIVAPLYGTSQGNKAESPNYLTFEPGTPYEWTLEYDPSHAEGRGAITFTLGERSIRLDLRNGEKGKGAKFNCFGVFNMQWANSKWCEIYLDDITYTVGKE